MSETEHTYEYLRGYTDAVLMINRLGGVELGSLPAPAVKEIAEKTKEMFDIAFNILLDREGKE